MPFVHKDSYDRGRAGIFGSPSDGSPSDFFSWHAGYKDRKAALEASNPWKNFPSSSNSNSNSSDAGGLAGLVGLAILGMIGYGFFGGDVKTSTTESRSATNYRVGAAPASTNQRRAFAATTAAQPNIFTVAVRCQLAVAYVAPNGGKWDGHSTIQLRQGNVISKAVPYIQASDNRFFKGHFGKLTVFVRQSDVDGVNCAGR